MNPPTPSSVDFVACSGLFTQRAKQACIPGRSNDICPKKAAIHQANHGGDHFHLGSIEQVCGTAIPKGEMGRASFPWHTWISA